MPRRVQYGFSPLSYLVMFTRVFHPDISMIYIVMFKIETGIRTTLILTFVTMMQGIGNLHLGSLGDSRLSILHFQVHWLPY